MVDEPSPIAAPERLRNVEVAQSVERRVVYSDIDFNRHVNTMRYIDMIFNNIPLDVIEHNNGLRIDLNFLAEARYGETLTVGFSSEESCYMFEISSDAGKTLCRAKVVFR